jgi:CBS domain-containing protein
VRIEEVMTTAVETIGSRNTVQRAVSRMSACDVGILLVRDRERIVGVVTDRDIARRVVVEGRDVRRTKVREIMTTEFAYCYQDQEVEAAAVLMEAASVRQLPVFTREDELVGIVALGDIARVHPSLLVA